MPEEQENQPQKAVKSKKRLIASIIRWFFVVVFAALLILGLFFHVPWKAPTILGIFLAALTVLPRPYSKYFWGCVGVVLIALTIWVFLPDDNEGWRPYTFDKEEAALNAKYAIPDEENAAVIYKQLPEIFDDPCVACISEDYNTINVLRREPWSAEDYPEYAEWFDNHQGIIELLLQTTQYERCYFGTKADVVLDGSQMQVSAASRRAAQLLRLAANYDVGRGELDNSLEKYHALICIGNHYQQNPSIIHKLVGISIEALGIGGLKEFIIEQDVTAEQIEQAEEMISKADCSWDKHLPQIIEYEKLYLKNFIANYYEINPQDRVRFTRDPWQRWREYYKEMLETGSLEHEDLKEWYESVVHPSYGRKKLWKASTLLMWLSFPSNPQTAGQIIDDEYQHHYEMLKPDYDWQQKPKGRIKLFSWPTFTASQLIFRPLIQYFEGNKVEVYHTLHKLYIRFDAGKRGALLTAALKRYKNKNGSWPDSLGQIEGLTAKGNFTDPRSNGPFIYKTTEEGFLLYSIGPNKIDEKGNRREPADDWPIWPRMNDPIWKQMRQDANDTTE
ncbi:MAG: hypothetical protein PVG93_03565 [Phycisphaerales bacterium]|jgi:hypothetical protein